MEEIPMKKALKIALLLLTLAMLTSCGKAGSKYSQFPVEHYNNSVMNNGNIELTNGALVNVGVNDLYRERFSDNDPNFGLNCIFDEETKTLIPLCFRPECTHETEECFARNFYLPGYMKSYGIYNDEVFVLTDVFQGSPVDISVYFLSLDGTMLRKTVLDKKILEESVSGEEIIPVLLTARMVSYGNSIYFTAIDNVDANKYYPSDSTETVTHWIIGFDLEKEEFALVATFELPNTVTQPQHLYVAEDRVMMTAEGSSYVADISSGEQTVIDHTSIVSDLIDDGKLPRGGQVSAYYRLHKNLIVVEQTDNSLIKKVYYVDPVTKTLVNPGQYEAAAAENYRRESFEYNNDLYLYSGTDDESLIYFSNKTREKIYVNRRFGGDKLLFGVFAISDNYVIFSYRNLNSAGTTDPEFERITENGVDVTYYLSNQLACVSKADFIDGSLDTPFYFNVESGTFEQ